MPSAPHPLESDEDRRARHLFVLKSLTDRGFTLALKAADEAEAQLDRADPAPDEPPAPPARDYHQLFQRYVSLVRLLVTAEHRIATGTAAPRRTYKTARPVGPVAADPRRPRLRQFIHDLTRNSPGRAALRNDCNASLDDALEADQDLTLPAGAILAEICEEYGLPFDIAKIPDEFLDPPNTGPPHPRPS